MECFSLSLDLSSFFSDFRAKSLIYVDTSTMKKILQVENHIRSLFSIDDNLCLLCNDHYLPGCEDTRVLKSCHSIKAVAAPGNCKGTRSNHEQLTSNVQHEAEDQSNDNCSNLLDASGQYPDHVDMSPTKKKKHKKKRKRTQDKECADTCLEVPNSPTLENSAEFRSDSFSDNVKVRKHKRNRKKMSENMPIDTEKEQQVIEDYEGAKETSDSKALLEQTTATEVDDDSWNSCGIEQLKKRPCIEKAKIHDAEENGLEDNNMSAKESVNSIIESASAINTSALETDTNMVTQPSREKRKRKRKRPNKTKCQTTIIQPELPPAESTLPVYCSKQNFTKKKHHIHFPDEDELTFKNTIEKEVCNEAVITTEAQAQNGFDGIVESAQDQASEKTSSQECVKRVTCQVTTEEATPMTTNSSELLVVKEGAARCQVKYRRLSKSAGGIGDLLSMLRNDDGQKPLPDATRIPHPVPSLQTETTPTTSDKPVSSSSPLALNAVALSCSSTSITNVHVTPTEFIPQEKSTISFRILKISQSYCPEVSGTIIAVVEKTIPQTKEVILRLMSGAAECASPKGKFDLDEDEPMDTALPETIQLKWEELIEPTVQP